MSTKGVERVVLALGANLGDRRGSLLWAARGLQEGGLEVDLISSIYETPPLGFAGQPPFLNAVVAGFTAFTPRQVLAMGQGLESEAGRVRSFSNAPRPLDVDLIFFGDRFVREEGMRIPHPRWRDRSFVVLPLQEILPGFRDPETGLCVEEVARAWPLAPEDIQILEGPEAFHQVLRRGNG